MDQGLPPRAGPLLSSSGEVRHSSGTGQSEVGTGAALSPASEPGRLGVGTFTLAMALVVAVAVGGSISCMVNYDLIGNGHLPRVAVFCVFLLVGVNALWALARRRRLLDTGDLGFVYSAILVMSGLPGVTIVSMFYIGLVAAQYHAAGAGNEYATEVLPYLRDWMVPAGGSEDPNIAWAFHGVPDGAAIPYGAWVRPILAWTPFLLATLAIQVLAASLFRRRWDDERLTYPLAQAPVELVTYTSEQDAVPSLLRSRLFWALFLVPLVAHTENALHLYYPATVGPVNLYPRIGTVFGEPPWFYFDGMPLNVYFETIGATYLIPTQMGLSLWVFWLLRRFIMVYRHQRGLGNHDVYLSQTGIGAQTVLALLCVRSIWRARRAEGSDARGALVGIVVCLAVIAATALAAGGPRVVVPALLTIALFLAGDTIVARLVAQSGLFCVWSPICPPHEIVARAYALLPGHSSTSGSWRQTMVALQYMSWNTQHTAGSLMANALQAQRIGSLTAMPQRHVLFGVGAALVVGYFACHGPALWAMYSHGIYDLGWFQRQIHEGMPWWVHNLTTALTPYAASDGIAMAQGAVVATTLYVLQTAAPWFPLQAFAYAAAMGPPWMMDRYGFSILMGWAVSYFVLKYGGVRTHRRLRPAAYGLIVGNAVVLLLWTIIDYIEPMQGVLIIE